MRELYDKRKTKSVATRFKNLFIAHSGVCGCGFVSFRYINNSEGTGMGLRSKLSRLFYYYLLVSDLSENAIKHMLIKEIIGSHKHSALILTLH